MLAMPEDNGQDVNRAESRLKLLAETHGSVSPVNEPSSPAKKMSTEFFKSAQWTADGTSVITTSSNNYIDTFIIPPDLLEVREEPLDLKPYSTITSPESVDATAIYPAFDLENHATCLVLSATNEHPIRLNSALTSDLVASYPLIKSTTEAYIKPHCLVFSSDGTRFMCGSDRLISTFDLSGPGQAPVSSISTGSKRLRTSDLNPATTINGIVSALAVDNQYNIMAAGTLMRHVGLYDTGGQGQCIGVFAVEGTAADKAIGGRGITQVVWSPCGRYLYIVERKSDGVMFYDIRKTGQLLGWLEDRKANTNQRMFVDMRASADFLEHTVWAGGTDGIVRTWANPHYQENEVLPTQLHSLHNDAVSSAVVHRTGTVLATASGQRHFNDGGGECFLRLWEL